MNKLVSLVRAIIPRSIRNALRRPRVTLTRVWARIGFSIGGTCNLQVLDDWRVRCHPICAPSFAVFREDPAQRAELNQFVVNCSPGMQLLDVGAHWGIFALAALHYGG